MFLQIVAGFSRSISVIVWGRRITSSGTFWTKLTLHMRKFWMISKGDSVRRPLLARVSSRSFTPTRNWYVRCLNMHYLFWRFKYLLLSSTITDSHALCQLCDGPLPRCRRRVSIDVRWNIFSSTNELTVPVGPRYHTSACKPHNPSLMWNFMTRSGVRHPTNMNFKCWNRSLSLTSAWLAWIDIYLYQSWRDYYRHVLKTNFYQPTKVALSFRLAPDFLPETEYPKKPFGMFIVIGT